MSPSKHAGRPTPARGRATLIAAGLALTAALAGLGCFIAAERAPRLVILVVFDALRSDHLSQYGYPLATSPGLEGLASKATVFENAYAPASYTTSSTASIFTGQSPLRHRARLQAARLRDELTTLPEILARRGYATRGISFNPVVSAAAGFAQGFADFVEREPDSPFNLYPDISVGLERLETWLEAPADESLFLYFQPMNTHGPYLVPPEAREALLGRAPAEGFAYYDDLMSDILRGHLERRAEVDEEYLRSAHEQYDTAIRYSTDQLGAFLDRLEAAGRLDDALVIVTADHGDELFEHGGFSHGYTLQEEVLRVPLIVKLPGQNRAQRIPTRVSLMDILPTIAEVIGTGPTTTADSRSLVPLIHGTAVPDEWERTLHLSVTFPARLDARGLIAGDEKLIAIHDSYEGVQRKVRLYDLRADPREEQNLASSRPERTRELVGTLGTDLAHYGRTAQVEDAVLAEGIDTERLRALGYVR